MTKIYFKILQTVILQVAILCGHPDLAGRLASANLLTPESSREQREAGLSLLTEAQLQRLRSHNTEYRQRFGFTFIICARENKAAAILKGLDMGLDNTREVEINIGIGEVKKIARLRALDVLKSLALNEDCLYETSRKYKKLFYWLQHNHVVPAIWRILDSSHSEVALIAVPLLLTSLTLPHGADLSWRVLHDDFNHAGRAVRLGPAGQSVRLGPSGRSVRSASTVSDTTWSRSAALRCSLNSHARCAREGSVSCLSDGGGEAVTLRLRRLLGGGFYLQKDLNLH